MGYDTTLFVVNAYDEPGTKPHYERYFRGEKPVKYLNRPSGSVIATIDLAKAGYQNNTAKTLSAAREAAENTGWELFLSGAKNGQTAMVDLYGEKVSSVPVEPLLAALHADNRSEGYYRRFGLAIAVLETVLKDFKTDRIMVFQYGH